jgi:hypothetical protein
MRARRIPNVLSSQPPGTEGPAIQRPSAVSAVGFLNPLLSNGLHRRVKMCFSAVAAPSCAVSAPRTLFRRAGYAGFRDRFDGGRSGSVHQCELPGSAAEKHQRLDGQLPAIGLKMNDPLLAIGEVEEIGKTDFSLATRRNTSS